METQTNNAGQRSHDLLPQTPAVSALVRRVVFKLNAELHFHGHKPLTDAERVALFDLGEASKILDGVSILPGMAQHEERARRDLLGLFDIFDQTMPTAASESPIQTARRPVDALADKSSFLRQQAD